MNRQHHPEEEQESFFISMTDIMVGLLFMFIMLVVYFATQVRIESEKIAVDPVGAYREKAMQQRKKILEGLKRFFEEEGFHEIRIDDSNGILRFPDGVLFGSGQYEFAEGTRMAEAVRTLANALAEVLPCSVLIGNGQRYRAKEDCQEGIADYPNTNDAFIEALYIEGHTDSFPISRFGLRGDPKLDTNLKLSTRRSANTFEKIMDHRPIVGQFYGLTSGGENQKYEPVVAVSGYGAQRPIAVNNIEQGRVANRRIDLRILMYQPYSPRELEQLMEQIQQATDESRGER